MRKAYLVSIILLVLFAVCTLSDYIGPQHTRHYNSENVYHPDETSNNDYLANSTSGHLNHTGRDSATIMLCKNY